jgi:restriction system protein
MAIPTFDRLLRPVLALAVERDISRRSATVAMADEFVLSEEEREARTPSGSSTTMQSRAGWAMTFLTKGGLIAKVAPKTYRATDAGKAFLSTHPEAITVKDLETIPGWKEAWKPNKEANGDEKLSPSPQTSTPSEALDNAVETLSAELRARLLQSILKQSPAFFERLVLDVLLAMGYGGLREDAAKHLGKSDDEGIDGRINQDPLGLDQIMVQAKRYAPDRPVDRKTIQAFIGSLAGQGVTKGVFITTSSFGDRASEFVLRGSNTKVVLIDGAMLLDLMTRHHIGVRVERQIEILNIDQNYFDEEEGEA